MSFTRILIIFCLFFQLIFSNKNKGVSKFERFYNECKATECSSRINDENCVFECISKHCYNQIFENYLLELGEVNTELKSKFEACFNSINKN